MRGRVIWENISRSVNGENLLGGVAYKICNAGRGYVKRAGLNQYERRAGHPEPAGWRA